MHHIHIVRGAKKTSSDKSDDMKGSSLHMSNDKGKAGKGYEPDPNFNYNDTLNRINQLRIERGWSVYRLAAMADLPESSLRNLFRRNNEPTIPTLRKICNGFGIRLQEFFGDEPIEVREVYSPDDKKLIDRFLSLDDSQKRRLSSYCDGLLKLREPYEGK